MIRKILITAALLLASVSSSAWTLFPTPQKMKFTGGHSRCTEIRYVESKRIPEDGYSIRITGRKITVRYSTAGGKLYSRQTLDLLEADGWPCCEIKDFPRCSWRGLMLDSGRQYQSVETIKSLLDLLFELKMNVFHWHLTEGLGWRLEIKHYPELTGKGAYVSDGPEQQGYYSQEEVREIVKYAAERNITVVPEIDIPGHAEAALFSYPEYGCFGEPAKIPQTGFTDCIFCAGKDATLEFLNNILDEVCELFSSEYIHLGGDEAPKGNWNLCPDYQRRIKEEGLKDSHELQLWLSARMALYLKSKGRKAIFWEDVIGDGDYPLPDNAVVQWWNYRRNKDANYRKAIEKGYPVICSPNYYNYLNFPETPWRGYGEDRTFSLEDAYLRNPADTALSENSPLTLGMECTLWTDYNLTEDLLDSRLFPRIYALAELMWRGGILPFKELSDRMGTVKMLVGTYTDGNDSKGVYLFDFNEDNAVFSLLDTAAAGNPSFIIPSDDRRFAWSVGEFEDGGQCACAYKLSGSGIDVINFQSTDGEASGAAPCNVIAADGHLITSNYTGGTLSSFPINEDGSLGALETQYIPEKDSPAQAAHLHCAFLSPDGKYLFANDLGLDVIYRFAIDGKGCPLKEASVAYKFDSLAHPGPRHAVFSKDGRFVYLIHELSDELSVLSYKDGEFSHISTVLAYSGEGHGSADIHLSPDGRFLYTSHRLKEDGISIFAVNNEDGSVSNVGYCHTGKHPRNFAITPNGKFLLCACRDDNRIEIYSIDSASGVLTFTGKTIEIPAPVCIRFYKP